MSTHRHHVLEPPDASHVAHADNFIVFLRSYQTSIRTKRNHVL